MANAVVTAILGATQDARVRAAMIMGAGLESNWNTGAVGDHGKSFGAYQIYTVAHPNVSSSQASDPVWSTNYMLKAYQDGVAKVSPGLWQSNPALAAATAAFYAERPAKMYSGYESKWSQVQAALNGQDVGTSSGSGATGGGVVPASNNLLSPEFWTGIEFDFRKGLMVAANFSLFFGAVLVGGIIMLVGFYILLKDSAVSSNMAKVSNAFGTVAGPGAKKAFGIARNVGGSNG